MRVFEEAVISGNMSGDAALLYTYGMYLSNGGTYDGFQEMDMDDIQLMYIAYEATRRKNIKETIEGIANLFGASDFESV